MRVAILHRIGVHIPDAMAPAEVFAQDEKVGVAPPKVTIFAAMEIMRHIDEVIRTAGLLPVQSGQPQVVFLIDMSVMNLK